MPKLGLHSKSQKAHIDTLIHQHALRPNPICKSHCSIIPQYYHHVLALVFAVSEINKDASLLPNSTLGYKIYEKAYNALGTSFGTMSLLFAGQGNPLNYHCGRKRKPVAIIGGLTSQNTNQMPHILHIYKMPQVCITVCRGV